MIRELFDGKPELKKIILIALGGIVGIIIIFVVISLFKTDKLTFEQLEEKMKTAATSYYSINEDKLPIEGSSVTISYDTLVSAKKIKEMNKYLNKGISCTGNVVVKNTNNNYSYTPYLDCGETYKTTEFYNKILEDNEIVTSDSGLYINGDSRAFRGENIDNFVLIGNNMWRIVKIEYDNSTKLILYSGMYKSSFDDRYNSDRNSSIGKNIYSLSRLKETIDGLYDDETLLSSDIKGKLVSKPLCVAGRNDDDVTNDGSIECSETLDSGYIGSLSAYEYIYASLDNKCETTNNSECQNYNYLSETENNIAWWLSTPVKENTYQVYYITSSGDIKIANCSTTLYARPTIYLGAETIYSSGTGTLEDPYIIR